jgi:hypothetical protein
MMSEAKAVKLGHDDCLAILRDPSTRNILEKLGYEYSVRGQDEYRKERPNIVPALVDAIVAELQRCPVFPTKFLNALPEIGVYIQWRDGDFVVMDIDKPSVWMEHVFPTAERAARVYVGKILDPYWLKE